MATKDPAELEKEASTFFAHEKYDEAFGLFREAAGIHRKNRNHKQASLCFVSAASSWSLRCKENSFFNAALAYEEAAKDSEKTGDMEYASLLYRYAAVNYEKDAEFGAFSDCSYLSKECNRKFLWRSLLDPQKFHHMSSGRGSKNHGGYLKRLGLWIVLTFSWIIWGHGERPFRTISTAGLIIFLSAVFYHNGYLVKDGTPAHPDAVNSLYFSVVTFTTVGYGDLTAFGANKFMAMFEAFSGIFVMPLFMISLTKRYLRI